jgi:hypothetical protein
VKRLLALIAIMAMVGAAELAAATVIGTPSNDQLMGAKKVYDSPSGNATVGSPVLNPPVHFPVTLTNPGSGFSQVQIGYKMWENWDWSLFDGDGSGYDGWGLYLDNPNTEKYIMVNVFVNTGWTDPPWNQANRYYENAWTWLAPGETKLLVLDFATEGVVNEGYTSGIGVNVGTNIVPVGTDPAVADSTYGAGYWMYSGTSFDVSAEPIPEPGTLLLLGSGLAGLVGYGKLRFRRRKK